MKKWQPQHYNIGIHWQLKNTTEQFAESQKLAVALLVAAQIPNDDKAYDFFAVHLLTSSHAVRCLLPILPSRFHVPLVRQWWLFTLLVYIAQLRPKINIDTIKLVDLEGRDWLYVTEKAIKGKYRTDAHYVKALRSMHESSKTWGDSNEFYLKAAVKMGEEFDGWGGFGSRAEELRAHENAVVDEQNQKSEPRTKRTFSGFGLGAHLWVN